jgi:hypothetical protein
MTSVEPIDVAPRVYQLELLQLATRRNVRTHVLTVNTVNYGYGSIDCIIGLIMGHMPGWQFVVCHIAAPLQLR